MGWKILRRITMRKILFAILILFGLGINLYAIYPMDEVISDVYNPTSHALTTTGSSSVSGSTIVVSNFPANYDMSTAQQNLLARPTVHLDTPISVEGSTIIVGNFPTEYPLSSAQETLLSRPTVHIDSPVSIAEASLLQRPTVHMDSPVDVNNFPGDYPDSTVADFLAAGTTTYEKNPAKLYEGQIVYKSSGTSGLITGVTSFTVTVADKVRSFSFLYESPTGEYSKIEPSYTGTPISLNDGKYINTIIDYPQAITFSVTNMVVGSTMTWNVPTIK
jgi:hypothetical protein